MKMCSADLIRTVTLRRAPMIITQKGEAKVVVQDVESYERDRRTLLMLKLLAQGIADADAGRVVLQDDVFERAEKTLTSRMSHAGR